MDKQLKEQGGKTKNSVYGFIVEFMTTHGYSPSIKEIAEGTGIKSTSTVREHLIILEQVGKIHTRACSPRTISLVGYELRKVGAKI